MTKTIIDRVHLIAHAGGGRKDLDRLGFANGRELLAFVCAHLPHPWRLTGNAAIFEVDSDESRGGRRDDAARIRDLQAALDDPRTRAIVSANGGAYLTRILPELDFTPLTRRRQPLWMFGFSELTTLVNIVAGYRSGRGVYWLCPDYLAWKVRPRGAARDAIAAFWRTLPWFIDPAGQPPGGATAGGDATHLPLDPIRGRLVAGRVETDRVRMIGGCISVLCALLTGGPGRRLRPDGRWLMLEDINEDTYRIDRYLAALKLAGWLDRIGGLVLGDFHTKEIADQHPCILELLRFHLPRDTRLPVVTTRSFGHLWPMVPVLLNRPLPLRLHGRDVTIGSAPR